jgi:hypothetical protein
LNSQWHIIFQNETFVTGILCPFKAPGAAGFPPTCGKRLNGKQKTVGGDFTRAAPGIGLFPALVGATEPNHDTARGRFGAQRSPRSK